MEIRRKPLTLTVCLITLCVLLGQTILPDPTAPGMGSSSYVPADAYFVEGEKEVYTSTRKEDAAAAARSADLGWDGSARVVEGSVQVLPEEVYDRPVHGVIISGRVRLRTRPFVRFKRPPSAPGEHDDSIPNGYRRSITNPLLSDLRGGEGRVFVVDPHTPFSVECESPCVVVLYVGNGRSPATHNT